MRRLSQSGQGMTEYILIVALIAIAVIGAVKFFGGNVKSGFQNAGNQLGAATSGNSNSSGSGSNAIFGKN